MEQSSVIVIDASAALRQQVRFVLSPLGYEIFESDSLRSGLKKIQEEPVCLVIVDSTLPDFSMRLLREVHGRKSDSSVPVLLLHSDSGRPGVDDIASTSTSGNGLPTGTDFSHDKPGCYYHLAEPFSSIGLLSIVRKALRESGRDRSA